MEDKAEKKYDLEERTFLFSKNIRLFIKRLSKSASNSEDSIQLIRSSGSIGANYLEANGNLGPKDLIMRIKICRKESKESKYWLRLMEIEDNQTLENERGFLVKECQELILIFGAIINKLESKETVK